jgi:excisionase family DNA binding protein
MRKRLLTIQQLATALQVSERSIRRAYRKGEIPVERFCRFVRFDLEAVRAALRQNGQGVHRDAISNGRRRSATGGDSRRRAQRTRPRLGKTGASIARKERRL